MTHFTRLENLNKQLMIGEKITVLLDQSSKLIVDSYGRIWYILPITNESEEITWTQTNNLTLRTMQKNTQST